MKRIAGFAFAILAIAVGAHSADAPYVPTDAERARWTLQDMRSWKIALEAYKIDHDSFPDAKTLEEAVAVIEGPYIRQAPRHDAWGRAFIFERVGEGFRIVSAGSDGIFQKESWSEPARGLSHVEDAVITDEGKFWFRSW